MENEVQEQYEYARKRLRQKKVLYSHFVLFLVGSLFMFVVNVLLEKGLPDLWYIWAATVWGFIWILHFINVYFTNRFMNKNWERQQIDRLIARQQNKIRQLESKVESGHNNEL